MRKYLEIDLAKKRIKSRNVDGHNIIDTGRHFIAERLLAMGVAQCDPLSDANPLIFSAGPFAGTNLSNANRLSVGCKSPLTGGIKEANAGGTFAVAMGQLQISGLTLHGASDRWVVIRITKDGVVRFVPADNYLGKGNFDAAAALHADFGERVSIALCGPVGEFEGLLAGIAFSDRERRPARLAARGGVGAVMGHKKVKAIVVDFDKNAGMVDRKRFIQITKVYTKKLDEQDAVRNLRERGTALVADFTNHVGAMPTDNFRIGQPVDTRHEPMRVGGDFIRDQNSARGGETSHACMPGCLIQCSNVYVDSEGKELVSPLEYETLGLLGTNCGLSDPDDIARLNAVANDLGIDTIELGATLGVAMEAGQALFGDVGFMTAALEDIRRGTERGRILAQGAARAGAHFGVERIPVIKNQAISAYDPRVIEVTGISMTVTAQGADHTVGNMPTFDCAGKTLEELVDVSVRAQVNTAIADSMGLCIFGRSVNDSNLDLIADAINSIHGTAFEADDLRVIGRRTLILERAFNQEAGLDESDDALPRFFYIEPLLPTGKLARHDAARVARRYHETLDTFGALDRTDASLPRFCSAAPLSEI